MAFLSAGTMAKLTKDQVDTRVGNDFAQIFAAFQDLIAVKAMFDAHSDAEFEVTGTGPGPIGYPSGTNAINTLKSAVNQMCELGKIARGEASQNTLRGDNNPFNYRTTAQLVTAGTIV